MMISVSQINRISSLGEKYSIKALRKGWITRTAQPNTQKLDLILVIKPFQINWNFTTKMKLVTPR